MITKIIPLLKLFEEIKVMFQDLPSRIEKNIRFNPAMKEKRQFNPMLLDELIRATKNLKVGIIIGLSFLRVETPWLWEIGLETLRIIDSNEPVDRKKRSLYEFEKMIKISTQNPIMRDLLINSRDEFTIYDKLPRMLIKSMHIYMEESE